MSLQKEAFVFKSLQQQSETGFTFILAKIYQSDSEICRQRAPQLILEPL